MGSKCCKCTSDKGASAQRSASTYSYPKSRWRDRMLGNGTAGSDDISVNNHRGWIHPNTTTPAPVPGGRPQLARRLSDLSVKVGTRTRFLVEVISASPVTVRWEKDGVAVKEDDHIKLVTEGQFHCIDISPVTLEDSGVWRVRVTNEFGATTSAAQLSLIVPKAYKEPEFVEPLRAVLTAQGTVSLECKVVGVPTPGLRWFKGDTEIKAGDVLALTHTQTDPSSLGTYTCLATNCMGSTKSTSIVHIDGASGSGEGFLPTGPKPIFIRELRNERVKIGATLTLECKVNVPPWPEQVTWYNPKGEAVESERFHIMEDGAGIYSLRINSITAEDNGEWKCVATSKQGVKSMSKCNLSVNFPKNYRKPKFLESLKAILTEEGLVSFECKVVGYPTPHLSWFKDGQELKPGDVYQLTGTNSLGSYCCIARNCMGEAESSAELTLEDIKSQLSEEERLQLTSEQLPPRFIQGLKSTEAKICENHRFSVQVSVFPEPTVLWFRDDEIIEDNDRIKLEKEKLGFYHLNINKLEFVDQAEWKCVATNDFGQSITSCFLKLNIPRHYKKPKFLEDLKAVLSEEGAVNLECKVIGVPQPKLKWYKDGKELKPGDIHRIISGQDGTCCLGTYTCLAQNCMGTVSSSASLLGFEDKGPKTARGIADSSSRGQALTHDRSLSTIHEERTSQLHDTDKSTTIDDRAEEVSFSFDGKEVSVSLYETPDLTEEEALQIVEMYADQISEHVSEHNVVELPPMRFTKESATSGKLMMEAVVIDVSPEYFTTAPVTPRVIMEDDLRTDMDVDDDFSVIEENNGANLIHDDISPIETIPELEEENVPPVKPPRAKHKSLEDTVEVAGGQVSPAKRRSKKKSSDSEREDDSLREFERRKLQGEQKVQTRRRTESELEDDSLYEFENRKTKEEFKSCLEDLGIFSPETNVQQTSENETMYSVAKSIDVASIGSKKSLTEDEGTFDTAEDSAFDKSEISALESLAHSLHEIQRNLATAASESSTEMHSAHESIAQPLSEVQKSIEIVEAQINEIPLGQCSPEVLQNLVQPINELQKNVAKLERSSLPSILASVSGPLQDLDREIKLIQQAVNIQEENYAKSVEEVQETLTKIIERQQSVPSDMKTQDKLSYELSELEDKANNELEKYYDRLLALATAFRRRADAEEDQEIQDILKSVGDFIKPLKHLTAITSKCIAVIVEDNEVGIMPSPKVVEFLLKPLDALKSTVILLENVNMLRSHRAIRGAGIPVLYKVSVPMDELETTIKLVENLSAHTAVEFLAPPLENLMKIVSDIDITSGGEGFLEDLPKEGVPVVKKLDISLAVMLNCIEKIEKGVTVEDTERGLISKLPAITKPLDELKKSLRTVEKSLSAKTLTYDQVNNIAQELSKPLQAIRSEFSILQHEIEADLFGSEENPEQMALLSLIQPLESVQNCISSFHESVMCKAGEEPMHLRFILYALKELHGPFSALSSNIIKTEQAILSQGDPYRGLKLLARCVKDLKDVSSSIKTDFTLVENISTTLNKPLDQVLTSLENILQTVDKKEKEDINIDLLKEMEEPFKNLQTVLLDVESGLDEPSAKEGANAEFRQAIRDLRRSILMMQDQSSFEYGDEPSSIEANIDTLESLTQPLQVLKARFTEIQRTSNKALIKADRALTSLRDSARRVSATICEFKEQKINSQPLVNILESLSTIIEKLENSVDDTNTFLGNEGKINDARLKMEEILKDASGNLGVMCSQADDLAVAIEPSKRKSLVLIQDIIHDLKAAMEQSLQLLVDGGKGMVAERNKSTLIALEQLSSAMQNFHGQLNELDEFSLACSLPRGVEALKQYVDTLANNLNHILATHNFDKNDQIILELVTNDVKSVQRVVDNLAQEGAADSARLKFVLSKVESMEEDLKDVAKSMESGDVMKKACQIALTVINIGEELLSPKAEIKTEQEPEVCVIGEILESVDGLESSFTKLKKSGRLSENVTESALADVSLEITMLLGMAEDLATGATGELLDKAYAICKPIKSIEEKMIHALEITEPEIEEMVETLQGINKALITAIKVSEKTEQEKEFEKLFSYDTLISSVDIPIIKSIISSIGFMQTQLEPLAASTNPKNEKLIKFLDGFESSLIKFGECVTDSQDEEKLMDYLSEMKIELCKVQEGNLAPIQQLSRVVDSLKDCVHPGGLSQILPELQAVLTPLRHLHEQLSRSNKIQNVTEQEVKFIEQFNETSSDLEQSLVQMEQAAVTANKLETDSMSQLIERLVNYVREMEVEIPVEQTEKDESILRPIMQPILAMQKTVHELKDACENHESEKTVDILQSIAKPIRDLRTNIAIIYDQIMISQSTNELEELKDAVALVASKTPVECVTLKQPLVQLQARLQELDAIELEEVVSEITGPVEALKKAMVALEKEGEKSHLVKLCHHVVDIINKSTDNTLSEMSSIGIGSKAQIVENEQLVKAAKLQHSLQEVHSLEDISTMSDTFTKAQEMEHIKESRAAVVHEQAAINDADDLELTSISSDVASVRDTSIRETYKITEGVPVAQHSPEKSERNEEAVKTKTAVLSRKEEEKSKKKDDLKGKEECEVKAQKISQDEKQKKNTESEVEKSVNKERTKEKQESTELKITEELKASSNTDKESASKLEEKSKMKIESKKSEEEAEIKEIVELKKDKLKQEAKVEDKAIKPDGIGKKEDFEEEQKKLKEKQDLEEPKQHKIKTEDEGEEDISKREETSDKKKEEQKLEKDEKEGQEREDKLKVKQSEEEIKKDGKKEKDKLIKEKETIDSKKIGEEVGKKNQKEHQEQDKLKKNEESKQPEEILTKDEELQKEKTKKKEKEELKKQDDVKKEEETKKEKDELKIKEEYKKQEVKKEEETKKEKNELKVKEEPKKQEVKKEEETKKEKDELKIKEEYKKQEVKKEEETKKEKDELKVKEEPKKQEVKKQEETKKEKDELKVKEEPKKQEVKKEEETKKEKDELKVKEEPKKQEVKKEEETKKEKDELKVKEEPKKQEVKKEEETKKEKDELKIKEEPKKQELKKEEETKKEKDELKIKEEPKKQEVKKEEETKKEKDELKVKEEPKKQEVKKEEDTKKEKDELEVKEEPKKQEVKKEEETKKEKDELKIKEEPKKQEEQDGKKEKEIKEKTKVKEEVKKEENFTKDQDKIKEKEDSRKTESVKTEEVIKKEKETKKPEEESVRKKKEIKEEKDNLNVKEVSKKEEEIKKESDNTDKDVVKKEKEKTEEKKEKVELKKADVEAEKGKGIAKKEKNELQQKEEKEELKLSVEELKKKTEDIEEAKDKLKLSGEQQELKMIKDDEKLKKIDGEFKKKSEMVEKKASEQVINNLEQFNKAVSDLEVGLLKLQEAIATSSKMEVGFLAEVGNMLSFIDSKIHEATDESKTLEPLFQPILEIQDSVAVIKEATENGEREKAASIVQNMEKPMKELRLNFALVCHEGVLNQSAKELGDLKEAVTLIASQTPEKCQTLKQPLLHLQAKLKELEEAPVFEDVVSEISESISDLKKAVETLEAEGEKSILLKLCHQVVDIVCKSSDNTLSEMSSISQVSKALAQARETEPLLNAASLCHSLHDDSTFSDISETSEPITFAKEIVHITPIAVASVAEQLPVDESSKLKLSHPEPEVAVENLTPQTLITPKSSDVNTILQQKEAKIVEKESEIERKNQKANDMAEQMKEQKETAIDKDEEKKKMDLEKDKTKVEEEKKDIKRTSAEKKEEKEKLTAKIEEKKQQELSKDKSKEDEEKKDAKRKSVEKKEEKEKVEEKKKQEVEKDKAKVDEEKKDIKRKSVEKKEEKEKVEEKKKQEVEKDKAKEDEEKKDAKRKSVEKKEEKEKPTEKVEEKEKQELEKDKAKVDEEKKDIKRKSVEKKEEKEKGEEKKKQELEKDKAKVDEEKKDIKRKSVEKKEEKEKGEEKKTQEVEKDKAKVDEEKKDIKRKSVEKKEEKEKVEEKKKQEVEKDKAKVDEDKKDIKRKSVEKKEEKEKPTEKVEEKEKQELEKDKAKIDEEKKDIKRKSVEKKEEKEKVEEKKKQELEKDKAKVDEEKKDIKRKSVEKKEEKEKVEEKKKQEVEKEKAKVDEEKKDIKRKSEEKKEEKEKPTEKVEDKKKQELEKEKAKVDEEKKDIKRKSVEKKEEKEKPTEKVEDKKKQELEKEKAKVDEEKKDIKRKSVEKKEEKEKPTEKVEDKKKQELEKEKAKVDEEKKDIKRKSVEKKEEKEKVEEKKKQELEKDKAKVDEEKKDIKRKSVEKKEEKEKPTEKVVDEKKQELEKDKAKADEEKKDAKSKSIEKIEEKEKPAEKVEEKKKQELEKDKAKVDEVKKDAKRKSEEKKEEKEKPTEKVEEKKKQDLEKEKAKVDEAKKDTKRKSVEKKEEKEKLIEKDDEKKKQDLEKDKAKVDEEKKDVKRKSMEKKEEKEKPAEKVEEKKKQELEKDKAKVGEEKKDAKHKSEEKKEENEKPTMKVEEKKKQDLEKEKAKVDEEKKDPERKSAENKEEKEKPTEKDDEKKKQDVEKDKAKVDEEKKDTKRQCMKKIKEKATEKAVDERKNELQKDMTKEDGKKEDTKYRAKADQEQIKDILDKGEVDDKKIGNSGGHAEKKNIEGADLTGFGVDELSGMKREKDEAKMEKGINRIVSKAEGKSEPYVKSDLNGEIDSKTEQQSRARFEGTKNLVEVEDHDNNRYEMRTEYSANVTTKATTAAERMRAITVVELPDYYPGKEYSRRVPPSSDLKRYPNIPYSSVQDFSMYKWDRSKEMSWRHLEFPVDEYERPQNYRSRRCESPGLEIQSSMPGSLQLLPPIHRSRRSPSPLQMSRQSYSTNSMNNLLSSNKMHFDELYSSRWRPPTPTRSFSPITKSRSAGRIDRYEKRAYICNGLVDKTVTHGGKIRLTCNIGGDPEPRIEWLKDSTSISLQIDPDRYTTALDYGVASLEITGAMSSDSGQYTCVVRNPNGHTSASTATVRIAMPDDDVESKSWDNIDPDLETDSLPKEVCLSIKGPDIGMPKVTGLIADPVVPAGGTIALHVEVTGCSRPEITWLREGNPIQRIAPRVHFLQDGGLYTLLLEGATPAESGVYTCRVSGGSGKWKSLIDTTATVQVVERRAHEKPALFTVKPDSRVILSCGDDMTLTCYVSGEPKPRVTLMKGIKDITNSCRTLKETFGEYVRLSLKRVTKDDAGTYFIQARNVYGTDRAFVTLEVRDRPRSLSPPIRWDRHDSYPSFRESSYTPSYRSSSTLRSSHSSLFYG